MHRRNISEDGILDISVFLTVDITVYPYCSKLLLSLRFISKLRHSVSPELHVTTTETHFTPVVDFRTKTVRTTCICTVTVAFTQNHG
jgi:hypothetical protein